MPPDLVWGVLTGVASGLLVRVLVFLSKRAYRFAKKAIAMSQQQQMRRTEEPFISYSDVEELLGDFIEKYQELREQTPALSKWEFVFRVTSDAMGLVRDLIIIAIRRLIGSDETPRA